MSYETGWFGVPGRTSSSKVHVYNTMTKRTLCNGKYVPASEFQYCANGIYLRFVTCPRCRIRGEKILSAIKAS